MKVWAVTAEVEVLVLAETEEDACRIAALNSVEAIRDDVRNARIWSAHDAASGTLTDLDEYEPYHDGSVTGYLTAQQWIDRLKEDAAPKDDRQIELFGEDA